MSEVREALEAARDARRDRPAFHCVEPQRRHSFDTVLGIALAVIRNVPEGMTVDELRDELEEMSVRPGR